MFKKITSIDNLAVFQNFDWNTTVLERQDDRIKEFQAINIIYGRNYSGKTTLSRIIRAFETGKISKKYENPSFTVSMNDGSTLSEANLKEHSKIIRVFNEDFVRDNLKFIINPDDSIEPFAILGEDNTKIEEEIESLEKEVGSKEEGNESGLFKKLKDADKAYQEDKRKYEVTEKQLDNQLRAKATNRNTGIKYNAEKFGNQNYDIRELNKDLKVVLKDGFQPISNEEKKRLENLIEEDTLQSIPTISKLELNFDNFSIRTKKLVERKVVKSGKIEELVNNALLHNWAKKGKELHEDKREKCGFCGNHIRKERWQKLEQHFDEESEVLEKEIEQLLNEIEQEKDKIKEGFSPDKNLFYSKYHSALDQLTDSYSNISKQYTKALDAFEEQLKKRKNHLFDTLSFEEQNDYTNELLNLWDQLEDLREESNLFSESLKKEQKEAKKKLRLREVFDFINTIKYVEKKKEIEELEAKANDTELKKDEITQKIQEKVNLIQSKKRQLNDEENGARKINEYLNDFFGHDFISLQAIEEIDEEGEKEHKRIRFEVIRDGRTAYHLSEGECSLIAFCYFIAKLEDIDTKGSKPIIWIDDPVSSLDSNHIFFVYSLLKSKIVDTDSFEQLFITTHNLNFLKYLKRLKGGGHDRAFFIIDRKDKVSSILPMPKYLKEYITEFNYLFEQVYNCAKVDIVDDSNYTLFYNFGNNARKFLEIYLYYKYPDTTSEMDKLKKFFGDQDVPAILTDRINNEYSHLSGVFERGSTPVEVPEMKSVAEQIINRLKKDKEQYKSLLKSIGVEINESVEDGQ